MDKLRLASWNIKTLKKKERPNTIFKELYDHNIDIACLQETRLLGYTSKGDHHTISTPGSDGKCLGGVGFAIKNEFIEKTTDTCTDEERLITLEIDLNNKKIYIINVYAPTEKTTSKAKTKEEKKKEKEKKKEDKDTFYNHLEKTFSKIPPSDMVFIIGDFNAHVGADNVAWPTCLGPYGVDTINDNGQRLLEFCSLNNLCVLNTYFDGEENERCTWQHPEYQTWNQLDLCVTRERDRKFVINTCPVANILTGFDHKMVILEIDLLLEHPPIQIIESNLLPLFRYLLSSLMHIFFYPNSYHNKDMESAWMSIMNNVIYMENAERRKINNFIKLMKLSTAQIGTLFHNYQTTGECNEQQIRETTNSIIYITISIFDQNSNIQINDLDYCNQDVTRYFTKYTEVTISKRDIMKGTISQKDKEEIAKDIHMFTESRKLGSQIEIDMITLTTECCRDFVLPQDVLFIFIYKQCTHIAKTKNPSNFDIIDFVSTLCLSLKKCMWTKLGEIANEDNITRLQQHGIFKCKHEQDMLLALNLLQEKCLEKVVPLYIAFVDISQLLVNINSPISVKCFNDELIWALYIPFLLDRLTVNDKEMQNNEPNLWQYLLTNILDNSFKVCNAGFNLKYRFDGDIFDRSRLKIKTVNTFHLRAIQYAKCAAIFATSINDLQKCLDNFEKSCNGFGLSFVQIKPKVLAQNTEEIVREILIGSHKVSIPKYVMFRGIHFTGREFSLETEIFSRIYIACKKIHTHKTPNSIISKNDIHSSLLLNLEVLSLTKKQEKYLDGCNERCFKTYDTISKFISKNRVDLLKYYEKDTVNSITKRILYGDLVQERGSLSYFKMCKQDS